MKVTLTARREHINTLAQSLADTAQKHRGDEEKQTAEAVKSLGKFLDDVICGYCSGGKDPGGSTDPTSCAMNGGKWVTCNADIIVDPEPETRRQ